MTAEKLLEHQGAILLAQSDGCAVWQFRNETGDGTMTTYEIFSGVMLAFNDFHMERYECDFVDVVGTSGSGKSTLLHMMGGLDTPTIGNENVRGED